MLHCPVPPCESKAKPHTQPLIIKRGATSDASLIWGYLNQLTIPLKTRTARMTGQQQSTPPTPVRTAPMTKFSLCVGPKHL